MLIKPPGQPTAAAYLESVRMAVTPQRFAAAVDMIFRRAERDGDLEAFKAVAPYVVGPMRALEDSAVDDTITRIVAVVERRRALLGDKTVLEAPQSNEVDGEYAEIGENASAKTTKNSTNGNDNAASGS